MRCVPTIRCSIARIFGFPGGSFPVADELQATSRGVNAAIRLAQSKRSSPTHSGELAHLSGAAINDKKQN